MSDANTYFQHHPPVALSRTLQQALVAGLGLDKFEQDIVDQSVRRAVGVFMKDMLLVEPVDTTSTHHATTPPTQVAINSEDLFASPSTVGQASPDGSIKWLQKHSIDSNHRDETTTNFTEFLDMQRVND